MPQLTDQVTEVDPLFDADAYIADAASVAEALTARDLGGVAEKMTEVGPIGGMGMVTLEPLPHPANTTSSASIQMLKTIDDTLLSTILPRF